MTSDDGLRRLLLTLAPTARDKLRRVLILDQPDRDAIASELLRFGEANGDRWADVIDTLTMYPDARRSESGTRLNTGREHPHDGPEDGHAQRQLRDTLSLPDPAPRDYRKDERGHPDEERSTPHVALMPWRSDKRPGHRVVERVDRHHEAGRCQHECSPGQPVTPRIDVRALGRLLSERCASSPAPALAVPMPLT